MASACVGEQSKTRWIDFYISRGQAHFLPIFNPRSDEVKSLLLHYDLLDNDSSPQANRIVCYNLRLAECVVTAAQTPLQSHIRKDMDNLTLLNFVRRNQQMLMVNEETTACERPSDRSTARPISTNAPIHSLFQKRLNLPSHQPCVKHFRRWRHVQQIILSPPPLQKYFAPARLSLRQSVLFEHVFFEKYMRTNSFYNHQ